MNDLDKVIYLVSLLVDLASLHIEQSINFHLRLCHLLENRLLNLFGLVSDRLNDGLDLVFE
jgi:hypothetical protein